MDIKLTDGGQVVAVPSHEDGAIIFTHPLSGKRDIVDQVELQVGHQEKNQVEVGDTRAVEAYLLEDEERPGYFKIAGLIGVVTLPGALPSLDQRLRVREVLEVMPAPHAPASSE